MGLRDEVLFALENIRNNQEIKSNQEAFVLIRSDDDELFSLMNEFGLEQFASLCIVSEVKLERYPDYMRKEDEEFTRIPLVVAMKSKNQKCQRCWNYWPSVGADTEYPDLCERCVCFVRRA